MANILLGKTYEVVGIMPAILLVRPSEAIGKSRETSPSPELNCQAQEQIGEDCDHHF